MQAPKGIPVFGIAFGTAFGTGLDAVEKDDFNLSVDTATNFTTTGVSTAGGGLAALGFAFLASNPSGWALLAVGAIGGIGTDFAVNTEFGLGFKSTARDFYKEIFGVQKTTEKSPLTIFQNDSTMF